MKWKEIVQIHKTIRELPDYEPLLKSLHEEAFKLNDITTKVDITIEYGEFIISWDLERGHTVNVASFRISKTEDGRWIIPRLKVNDGFEVHIPTGSGGNIIIYQLGKITEEEEKSGK